MKKAIDSRKLVRHLRYEQKWIKDASSYYKKIGDQNHIYFCGRLKSINETLAWVKQQTGRKAVRRK